MNLRRILLIVLAAAMLLSLASCELLNNLPFDIPGLTDKGNGDGTGDGEGEDEGNEGEGNTLSGNVLIKDKKAYFTVVYTGEADATEVKIANDLVALLRNAGVDIADPVSDNQLASPEGLEVIVGTGVKGRDEALTVGRRDYGPDGYVVKSVDGKGIVLAGGTAKGTKKAYDVFTKMYLKVTDKTKEAPDFAFNEPICDEVFTKYAITSLKIAGNDIKDYAIIYDLGTSDSYTNGMVESFRDKLYSEVGAYLEIYGTDRIDEFDKKIVIRYVDDIASDTDGKGFYAAVDNGSLYIECCYANAFVGGFEYITKALIFDKINDVAIAEGYERYLPVSTVKYEYFGAKGDGKTDDFKAMLAAHKFANEGGQTVVGNNGSVYYVGDDFTETIYVQNNVNLEGASIIINDVGNTAYKYRNINLFTLPRQSSSIKALNEAQVKALFPNGIDIKVGDLEIPEFAPVITEKSYIQLTNKNHKDFKRYGSNTDDGFSRLDIVIINPDGTLDPTTPMAFDFDDITMLEIWTVTEKELRFENVTLSNICCKTVSDTNFKNAYKAYARGIGIRRANVVISNLTHRMIDEPLIDYTPDDNDKLCAKYGRRNESYPYAGTINMSYSHNILIENSSLAAHTLYWEEKAGIENSQLGPTDAVGMGSYGYSTASCNNIRFINVDQYAPTGLADSKYWGIMNGNTSKNLYFKDCEVNRFDAHRGFWNADLIDCTFGHTINVTGGGYLNMENVTKLTGDDMIFLRGDYGSSFDGDVYFTNCTLEAYQTYNSDLGQDLNTKSVYQNVTIIQTQFQATDHYLDWGFGYPCSLPHNVVFDNFTCVSENVYVFSTLADKAFEEGHANTYENCRSITFKNMDRIFETVEAPDVNTVIASTPVRIVSKGSED